MPENLLNSRQITEQFTSIYTTIICVIGIALIISALIIIIKKMKNQTEIPSHIECRLHGGICLCIISVFVYIYVCIMPKLGDEINFPFLTKLMILVVFSIITAYMISLYEKLRNTSRKEENKKGTNNEYKNK